MLHWLFDKTWKVVLEGAGVLSSGIALLIILAAEPTIHLPATVDSADVFRFPFHISNDGDFLTLFAVHPICGLGHAPESFPFGNFSIDRMSEVGDLPPQSPPAPFRCSIAGAPAVSGTTLFIEVTYKVRLFYLVNIPRTKKSHYQIMTSTKGDPYWIEGSMLGSAP